MIGSMNGDMERITAYYKTLSTELRASDSIVNRIKEIKNATK
jgi:hypothetical protein